MFQNISQIKKQEDNNEEQENDNKINVKNLFSIRDIVIYLISFLLCFINFGSYLISPFALSMFGATCSNKNPIIISFIIIGLGVLIKSGISGFLIYIFISILLILYILIIRPKEEEKRNEKQKLGKPLLIITFVINFISIIFTKIDINNLLNILIFSIIVYVFYKIFSYSLIVIKEYKIKKVFTLEEIIGAAIIFTILSLIFANVQIVNISITNILIIMIIILLGWQNGTVIGISAGAIIGMSIIIIGKLDISYLSIFIVSGFISGLINKLNKIFLAGLILTANILIYFINVDFNLIINIKESLIAMIILVFIPRNIGINIHDLIGKTKLLPVTGANKLENKEEEKYKLSDKNDNLKSILELKNEQEYKMQIINRNQKDIKKIFKEKLYNQIQEIEDNFIYEDIVNGEEQILDDIYDLLEINEMLNKEDIIKILENNNNYIIIVDKKIDQTIENDLSQIIKIINKTYREIKINLDWEQRQIDLEQKKLQNKFKLQIETKIIQKNEIISVSTIGTKLNNEKYLIGISQGLGIRTKS